MTRARLRGGWLVAAVVAAAVVLGLATTGLAAATGAFRTTSTRCSPPALPGRLVEVTATDMGPGMMGGPGPSGMRMMRLLASPATVPAGAVSLRVFNAGSVIHEVVVLPLPAGQAAGQRPVDADGTVDEANSLGEASRTCGAGTGDGIAPGATGWTTLTLRPGRYELLCNEPWHYSSGMYTELFVTGR